MPYKPLTDIDRDQPLLERGAAIWRYMDFPKFAAMLSSEGLYFAQVPLLGDPFEGSFVKAVKNNIDRMRPIIEKDWPLLAPTDEQIRNNVMTSRAYTYASCWHRNERESAAMWDLYARGGLGVAVRSTVGRLIDAFANVQEDVWIGQINYHDYETAQPPGNSLWTPMFQKRKSFEHEREIRAVVMDSNRMETLRGAWSYEPNPVPGRIVTTDLDLLIERIFLPPHAPSWYGDAVKRVVCALGFDSVQIAQSDMNASPIFY